MDIIQVIIFIIIIVAAIVQQISKTGNGQEANRSTPEREQKGRPDSYKTEY